MKEWLWEGTTHLGNALWTVTAENNPSLARRLIIWSNKTFPSVMSLICSWRNNKYTFDVQLFCSRFASVWIVAWHPPGSCFQSPLWGLEMEESTHSSVVPRELGHIWDTDLLSWKCSWGFCRLVQEVCAVEWSHAIFPRSWHYRISLSKDNLIHTQLHMKMQKKKVQQYTSYFKKLFARILL